MTTDHTPTPVPNHPGFWNYWSADGTLKVQHAEDIPSDEYEAMPESDRATILGSIAPAQTACPEREADVAWAMADGASASGL